MMAITSLTVRSGWLMHIGFSPCNAVALPSVARQPMTVRALMRRSKIRLERGRFGDVIVFNLKALEMGEIFILHGH